MITDQELRALLSDREIERKAWAIIRANWKARATMERGEMSLRDACKLYRVSYAVMRSIKCNKKMRGERGYVNRRDLHTYMIGYVHKPRNGDTLHR